MELSIGLQQVREARVEIFLWRGESVPLVPCAVGEIRVGDGRECLCLCAVFLLTANVPTILPSHAANGRLLG